MTDSKELAVQDRILGIMLEEQTQAQKEAERLRAEESEQVAKLHEIQQARQYADGSAAAIDQIVNLRKEQLGLDVERPSGLVYDHTFPADLYEGVDDPAVPPTSPTSLPASFAMSGARSAVDTPSAGTALPSGITGKGKRR